MDHTMLDAYRLARRHPDWPRARLAREMGVAEDEMGHTLHSLSQLQLVAPNGDPDGGPGRAVSVDQALGNLARAQSHAVRRALQEADELADLMDRLGSQVPRLRSHDARDVELSILKEAAPARLLRPDLAATARESVIGLCVEDALAEDPAGSRREVEALVQRGLTVRLVVQTAAVRRRASSEMIEGLASLGAQVRTRATLPFTLTIYDEWAAEVVSTPGRDADADALMVTSTPVVAVLTRLFAFCWNAARPWSQASGGPSATVTEEQLTMLRMLLDGATDQAIARHLGITGRTVSRKLRTLFDLLGVQTRFQLGAAARSRGLV